MTGGPIEGKNRDAVMRKVVGASIALGAIVAAAASQPGITAGLLEAKQAGAQQAATAIDARLGGVLAAFLQTVKDRAIAGAALPQVKATLSLLRDESIEGPVGATLRDFFRTEVDWEPWRRDYPVFGVSIEGARPSLLYGAPARSFFAEGLIQKAREGTASAAFGLAAEEPHAIGAAQVVVAGRSQPAVLLIGRPLDESTLAELGRRAALSLVLSDGKQPRARAGAAEDLARLTQAVGKEAEGIHSAADGRWAAATRAVVPGFWLWALADTGEATAAATRSASTTRTIVWSASGLIALLGLFIGFRRQAEIPSPATETTGVTTPARARPATRPDPEFAPVLEETTPTPLIAIPAATRGDGNALTDRTTSVNPAGFGTELVATPLRAFGRYVLINQLGEGGMARVYTAVVFGAEGFRRKFVVKRLRPELVEDSSVVAQFIDEAKMASSMVHSNIVPVLDFGKVDDEYYLATEYILGRDLARLTQRCFEVTGSAMPLATVLFVAHEICKALEYAHAKRAENGQPLGLVHRDVSPSNVLVSARGEVKLFDFGIVKAEGRVTRTQHGVVKGNVSFMAPEQARGIDVDSRADLYSLGLVLYSCLTGDVLNSGKSSYEMLLKAAGGPGPDEIAKLRRLPSPMAAILEKALQVEPAYRFQTASEFAAAIHPHVGHGGADLADLVARLFGSDFRQEEANFASAAPPASISAAGVSSLPDTR